jgi:hypothetical protein
MVTIQGSFNGHDSRLLHTGLTDFKAHSQWSRVSLSSRLIHTGLTDFKAYSQWSRVSLSYISAAPDWIENAAENWNSGVWRETRRASDKAPAAPAWQTRRKGQGLPIFFAHGSQKSF